MEKAEQEGRIVHNLPIVRGVPVQTAWDLGRSDDTVIWFYQYVANEYRLLDYVADYGQDVDFYCKILKDKAEERGWTYGPVNKANHWVPWDAKPVRMGMKKSIIQQARDLDVRMRLVPNLSVTDGIQAVRKILPKCIFDEEHTEIGRDGMREYRREWDPVNKCFRKHAVHNRASHCADGFRMLALAHQKTPPPPPPPPEPIKGLEGVSLNRLWEDAAADNEGAWRI